MKTTTAAMRSHLAGEVMTLATCWKLTRRDKVVMGFTDHDVSLEIDGVRYMAETGFTPSAVVASSQLDVDNLDVQGMLESEALREDDVMAGLYDFAEIEIFQVNYRAPAAGRLVLRRGWLGEITLRNHRFVAEVRGLTQKLSQQLGDMYSPACRAELGDGRCKVRLEQVTHQGVVTAAETAAMFRDSGRGEAAGYFAAGLVTFTHGENAGLAMEVKAFEGGVFTLALPMPYEIKVGDRFRAQAGCDKNFTTCVGRFGNAVNFRGEPHVPGLDRMLETAATRSEWE